MSEIKTNLKKPEMLWNQANIGGGSNAVEAQRDYQSICSHENNNRFIWKVGKYKECN